MVINIILIIILIYFICYSLFSYNHFVNYKEKILVLYVFHTVNERVREFIKKSIFYDEYIDFIVISNNKNNIFTVPKYVKILFRDNIGYDFGGWSDALLTDNLYKNYGKFIFVNSSVTGPFIPYNLKEKKWTSFYINGLQNDVKLFGSTINTMSDPINKSHIQSYIFSMDKITLEYLIDCEIFSKTNYAKTFNNAINDKEILMSRKIIEKNWNIGSLIPFQRNIDFRFPLKNVKIPNNLFLDDLMYDKYCNKLWNKYDLIFIKGNRITCEAATDFN